MPGVTESQGSGRDDAAPAAANDEGRLVALELDSLQVEHEVQERLALHRALTATARELVDHVADDTDDYIERALRRFGEVTDADRAAVFVFSPGGESVAISHEWARDGVDPVRNALGPIPLRSIPWASALFENHEVIRFSRPTDLPPDAAGELEIVQRHGICSAVAVPMVAHERPIGFVALETLVDERAWSDAVAGALEQLGAIVTSALDRRAAELARRRSEEALRQSEERFRRLVHASPDVVLVLDASGTIMYVSQVAEVMLGHRPDEKIGTRAWELVHPDDVDLALDELGAVIEGRLKGRQPARLRVLHANGSWVPVEVTAANLMEDPVLGGIVVNVRDMRERARMEATLREAEVRFQEAFVHAPIGMGLASPDGRFVRVNPAFCSMLGYTEDELLALSFADITHPDDLAENLAMYERMIAGLERQYSIEKRFRHKLGRWVWTRVSVSIVTDEDGAPLYSIGQIQDITERKRLEERLAYEARHDALTGLPLRKPFLEALERAISTSTRLDRGVAVLFIDLDHFKRVNDALGHAAGDDLLVEVARRLESRVRSIDLASRFGGDEFVVVCPEVRDARDAVAVAERLQERLSEPFLVRGVEVTVGASIGIAITDTPADAATLLRQADTAAYRAKERGRNRWEIFDDELRESVARRLDVESGLRHALEHDELTLLYQPIVSLDTGEVHSFEALVRWDRPGHGLIAPADFLAVAEETGLVVAVDHHVLGTACRQLAAWRDAGVDVPILSVNMSARQLLQPELADDLRRLLAETGVDPTTLCLELSETLLLHEAGAVLPVLHRLHALGVRLAIDDFGTGYSSLSHLRGMPVAHVKVDRGFVLELGADPAGATIASSVIGLAQALGMQVVAKSVETGAHVDALAAFGCELAQGFYYSAPVAADEVPRLLEPGRLPISRTADTI